MLDDNEEPLVEEDFITLQISGVKYETTKRTLSKFPNTLLGNEKDREPYFVPAKNFYFLDRCRDSFEAILFYYQSGTLEYFCVYFWVVVGTLPMICSYQHF